MIWRLLDLVFLDPLHQVEKPKQGDSVLSPYKANILFFNYPRAEGAQWILPRTVSHYSSETVSLQGLLVLTCK